MSEKTRVVIADDSALMRKKISDILNSDPDIEIAGIAHNGKQALEMVRRYKPDVVTLDVEMPVLNGLDTLGYIMSEIPTPCVMISAFTRNGAGETIRALEFGAVDFVTKPGGEISVNIQEHASEIIHKIKAAARIPVEQLKLFRATKAVRTAKISGKSSAISRIFTVASSTGGTQALATIVSQLRADLPAAVLVVQHMPPCFTRTLAERLNWQSKIDVVEAEDMMPVKPSQVIIARGGVHMEVSGDAMSSRITLTGRPPQMGLRPCADIMMRSAAETYGKKVVGVVLTGMGSDGTLGAQAIKSKGGTMLAQDKSSCVVYGMPRSVVEAGLVDKVVPLSGMAVEMERLAGGRRHAYAETK